MKIKSLTPISYDQGLISIAGHLSGGDMAHEIREAEGMGWEIVEKAVNWGENTHVIAVMDEYGERGPHFLARLED